MSMVSPRRSLSVAVVTLGCPKNQVDSEVAQGLLIRHGFQMIEEPAQADVIIVNTCGFIDQAKEESVEMILRLAECKRSGSCRLLVAMGCLSQRYPEELLKEIPELDGVVGTGDFHKVADLCQELLTRRRPERRAPAPASWTGEVAYLYDETTPRRRLGPAHSAYVKVSEGCNYRCSFCAIPSFRGDLKSRPVDSVVNEVSRLAGEGVKEINLIAQSLTSYGWDWPTGPGRPAVRDNRALLQLLGRLVSVDGIEWIRLFYTYPTDVSDALIELIATEPKICRYVDLPLQHIHGGILRAMNRKGGRREIERLIDRLRRSIPDLMLRTTMIVGFPGEGEAEFEELAEFIEQTEFDRLGVFTYSPEDGTSACSLGDPVAAELKAERRQRLLDLQEVIATRRLQTLVGQVRRVLIDGPSDVEGFGGEGRLEGQAPEIDGAVLLEEDEAQPVKPGTFAQVEITGVLGYDLTGRLHTREGRPLPALRTLADDF